MQQQQRSSREEAYLTSRCSKLLRFNSAIFFMMMILLIMLNHQLMNCLENFNKETIIEDIDYATTLYSLPSNYSTISPTSLCSLENGDFLFIDNYLLRRYYAHNSSVVIYLGKGTIADDAPDGVEASKVDTKTQYPYLVKGFATTYTGVCAYLDQNRVRLINSYSDRVKTIAGSRTGTNTSDYQLATNAAFSLLSFAAIDEYNTLFIVDSTSIKKVDNVSRIMVTIGGASPSVADPTSLYTDGSNPMVKLKSIGSITASYGVVYVSSGTAILKIENGRLYTVAGSWATCTFNSTYEGNATNVCLQTPKVLAFIEGELYFSDSNNIIRKIDRNGNIVVIAGGGFSGEKFDQTRTDQNMRNVVFSSVKGMSIFKKDSIEILISFTSSVIKVKEDGTFVQVIRKQIDTTHDSYRYGLQFSSPKSVCQVFNNGDTIIVGDDKKTVFRLSRRTKHLSPLYTFNMTISTIAMDRNDFTHFFIIVTNTTTSTFYFYEYNVRGRSMELIAGNSNGITFKQDGQSSLDTLIEDVDAPKVVNSTIFFRNSELYRIFELNPRTRTLKSYFGNGKSQGKSVSGLGRDIMTTQLFNDITLTTDPIGRVIIKNPFLIMYIEEKNNTLQRIIGDDANLGYNNVLPLPQEEALLYGGSSSILNHPTNQTFIFSMSISNNSPYLHSTIVELNQGIVREVFTPPSSVYFTIRKATNVYYYINSKDFYSYNPSTNTHTLIYSTSANPLKGICIKNDKIIVLHENYRVYLYEIGVSGPDPQSYGLDFITSIYCASNGEIFIGHYNAGYTSKISKVNTAGVISDYITNPALTGSVNAITKDFKGDMFVHMSNRIFKIMNATKEVKLIGGARKNTQFTDQAIDDSSSAFWTISSGGDIYYYDWHAAVMRKASASSYLVNDVIGNGTEAAPTKFYAYCNLMSEETKDGNFIFNCPLYPKNKALTANIYSPRDDKYYSSNFTIPVALDLISFTRDGEIIYPTTQNGIQKLAIQCERDRFGLCLQSAPYCFDIHYNNMSVCNGRGDCLAEDLCECYENYYSQDCSISTCFGLLASNSKVCSGRGKCVDFNFCECEDGYLGDECSIKNSTNITCFGAQIDDLSVCNGNGKCVDIDTCQCFSNFTGQSCKERLCSVGYFGEECQVSECFGLLSNNTQVCSSNGNCSSFNNCFCNSGFKGINCNEPIENSSGNQFMNGSNFNSTNNSTNLNYNNDTAQSNETMSQNQTNIENSTLAQNNSMVDNTSTSTNSSLTQNNSSTVFNSTNSGFNISTSNSTTNNHNETFVNNSSLPSNGSRFENTTSQSNSSLTNNSTHLNETNVDNNSTILNGTVRNETILQNNNTFINETVHSNTTQTYNSSQYLNSTTITTEISCFGVKKSNESVCNGMGVCISNNTCQCINGFYGAACFTNILTQPNFNSYGNTIEFHLKTSNPIQDSIIDCKAIISSKDLNLFGENPSCFWKNGSFYIELGGQNSITQNMDVQFNMNAFDGSLPAGVIPVYQTLTILPSNNPVKPIISVVYKKIVSGCESIEIDASGSYCGDLKPLKYNWSIESSSDPSLTEKQIIYTNSFHSSIQIPNSSYTGVFVVGLVAESSLSGAKSTKQFIEITKSSIPNPVISIINGKLSLLNLELTSIPIIIKKSVELPSCYFENTQFEYIWKQMSGPQIEYQIDSNSDLVITKFLTSGDQYYTFSVSAISKFNSNSNNTIDVSLSTKSQDLQLNIFTSSLTTSDATFDVEYSDPDKGQVTEVWTWQCLDKDTSQLCQDTSLMNALNACSNIKSSSCSIQKSSTLRMTLSLLIQKGSRSVTKSLDLEFPSTSQQIPPVTSLLSVFPNRYKVVRDEQLSLQLSVILNGDEKTTNEQDMSIEWSLNSQPLTQAMTASMSTDPSKSTSLILSLSELVEDTIYLLNCKVTDIRNKLSSQYSYSFKVVKSPKSCLCSITPSSGYALETSFSFACPNCQNTEGSIDFAFGFIDDKSGVKIPLYSLGEKFATYFPSPYSGETLTAYVSIVDTDTGASVEIPKSVTILTPKASTLTEVKKKVQSWQKYSSSLSSSDSGKLVFNSATISRTSELMLANLNARRRRSVCSNNGKINSDTGKCECNQGFTSTNCSLSIDDFNAIYSLREDMIDSMTLAVAQRNPLEMLSELHFKVFIFGLESITSRSVSIDSFPFDKLFNLTEKLIVQAQQNPKLKPSIGVDILCNSLINQILRLTNRDGVTSYSNRLVEMIKNLNTVMSRAYFVGQKDYKTETGSFSTTTTLNYRNQLSRKILSVGNDKYSISMSSIASFSNRVVMSTSLTSLGDMFGVQDMLTKQLTINSLPSDNSNEEISLTTEYNLISNIVKVDKKYNSNINFIINMKDYNFSNINAENIYKESQISETKETYTTRYIQTSLECTPLDQIFTELSSGNCSLQLSDPNIICNCTNSISSIVLIEKRITRTYTITKPPEIIIDIFPNSNLKLYGLYGLFGLLLLLLIGICVFIILAIVIMIIKKKHHVPSKHTSTDKEMASV